MKSIHSIVYFFVLKTAIADPQVRPSTSTTTTSIQQSSSDLSEEAIPQSQSLAPADLNVNAVGLTDTNRAGFHPFAIGKQNNHVVSKIFLGSMTIASVLVTLVLLEPWGLAATFLLTGGVMMFQPSPPNPDEVYQAIYGRIQNQINTAINNKQVSVMVSQLQTLSQSLNDQTVAYLAQLGITDNTKQTLQEMAQGTTPIPFVTASQVDNSMRVIDNILSAPNNWYTAPTQVDPSKAFVLTGVAGMGPNYCLHTKNFNLADGTDLVVDTQCNLNSLDDKLWGIAPNNQLILRTNNGDKCVAYNSKNGERYSKHVAIFDINSKQCASNRPITIREAADGTSSLYDGDRMLCIGNGKGKNLDVIVSRERRRNKCKNSDLLQFQTRIPVILNTAGAGGATGNSITPPASFDEIGVQLFYFSHFGQFHLASLKEMHLHGEAKAFAESQFYIKVEQYKQWIETFVPVFELYAAFANINATTQINDAKDFHASLTKVTLNAADISIQI